MIYYNEIDKNCVAWLKQLMAEGHLPRGDIDDRDIRDIKPREIAHYTQCHFFAGIGGWPLALQLAGIPTHIPLWTGSCPCQPFSAAGKRGGFADERHLWPDFFWLIQQSKPPVIFGEQVASSDGREWLARVRTDVESLDYVCGSADLCAAGVGAPHIRQRLYWVADSESERRIRRKNNGDEGRRQLAPRPNGAYRPSGLEHADVSSQYERSPGGQQSFRDVRDESIEGLVDAPRPRQQEQRSEYCPRGERCSGLVGFAVQAGVPEWNGPTVAVECSDGWRRVSAEPDAFPLAHGVLKRMGKLRGAGNAIVPQVAAAFIKASFLAIAEQPRS